MVSRWQSRVARTARTVKGAARGFAALLLAVAVLVGVTRGGARYFYCPMMHVVIDAPCCGSDEAADDADADSTEVRSRSCCEEHVLGKLPSAAVTSAPPVFEAPLLAVIPPIVVTSRARLVASSWRSSHHDRAGPRALARHRAELMVFLS